MTEPTETTLTLDRTLELEDPLGEPLPLSIGEIWLGETGGCRMQATLKPSVWRRVWDDGLFGLGAEVLQGAPPDFEDGKPVSLELALTPLPLRALRARAEPEIAALEGLAGRGSAAVLARTESWRARTAVQEVELPPELGAGDARLELGVSTIWAGEGPAAEDAAEAALGKLSVAVESVLVRNGLSWDAPDSEIYSLKFGFADQSWATLVFIDEEHRVCTITSALHPSVPTARRAAVAMELATRNYEMAVGSFDLDPEDGELRYRAGVDLGATPDPEPVIEALVIGHLRLFQEQYDWLAGFTA